MLVTTLITLPEDVYRFYRNTASHLNNKTVEQLISDTLTAYAHSQSAAQEISAENSSTSRSRNG